MLELKNLSRTYQPKKGVPVQALKNINLTFDDKGMVFVLGKSGSGKSTLLNLIGGLDFADSGEIIIDGKSSKDFKERDYDSYRNTYIGFVFQEYNILNEFTVGENISLALELQSQKEDKERLESILKEVDLEGYADRKPNELSGGQKQRVAIARAIIKDPKIIMADEPTGALDSETGKAIFDTLKKLSQDRLVIVVSHDRDFAEQYGDRIIELADGEVISDNTKQEKSVSTERKSEKQVELKKSRLPYKRALAMGARTLSRKKFRLATTIILCFFSLVFFGLAVTAASYSREKAEINLLEDITQDSFIVMGAIRDEGDFKGALQGASVNDLEKLRERTGIDFQGVLSTRTRDNYDYYESNYFADREYYQGNIVGALPADKDLFDSQGYTLYGRMPENEKEFIISKYIYDKMSLAGLWIEIENSKEHLKILPEAITDIQAFLDMKLKLTMPLSATPGCVVGVLDTNFDPEGRYEIFKQPNALTDDNFKDTNFISEIRDCAKYGYHTVAFVYPQLYKECEEQVKDQKVVDNVRNISGRFTLNETLYGNEYVNFDGVASEEVICNTEKILWIDGKGDRRELANNEIILGVDIAIDGLYPTGNRYLKYSHPKTYFDGLVSLKDDVRDYDMWDEGAGEVALLEEAESISLQELEKYKDYCREIGRVFTVSFRCFSADYNQENTDMETMKERDWRWSYAGYLYHPTVTEGGYYNNVTGRQSGEYIKNVLGDRWYLEYRLTSAPNSAQRIDAKNYNISYDRFNSQFLPNVEFVDDPVIVGVYFPKGDYPSNLIINNKMYQEAEHLEKIVYEYMIAPKTTDVSAIKKLAAVNCDISQVRSLKVLNYGVDFAYEINFSFNLFKPILFGLASILGLFSILLMGSYISSSIKAQKKQIGMLRALGATKSDIFAIYANESAIIASITLVLAVIFTLVICVVLNTIASNIRAVTITILQFGIVEIIALALICIGAAVLACLVPLYKFSKKRPVDSIQDR